MCLNLNVKNYCWAYELKNLSLEKTEINYFLLEVDRLQAFLNRKNLYKNVIFIADPKTDTWGLQL